MPTGQTEDLLTAGKLAVAWGVPKAALGKKLKELKVEPDLVKAGCSYYSAFVWRRSVRSWASEARGAPRISTNREGTARSVRSPVLTVRFRPGEQRCNQFPDVERPVKWTFGCREGLLPRGGGGRVRGGARSAEAWIEGPPL